MSSKTLSVSIG